MKKNIIYVFTIIIMFSSSGCKSENPTITLTLETIEAPQFSVATRTSLEVYRNGKTYEIDGSKIELQHDFNKDGESEIIVLKFSCGTYCVSWLLAYKYDSLNDDYFLTDELSANLKERTDINNDGDSEFILYNGFCFRWCTHAMEASALII